MVVGGKCPTPCKKGGGMSRRGTIRGDIFEGRNVQARCPDPSDNDDDDDNVTARVRPGGGDV